MNIGMQVLPVYKQSDWRWLESQSLPSSCLLSHRASPFGQYQIILFGAWQNWQVWICMKNYSNEYVLVSLNQRMCQPDRVAWLNVRKHINNMIRFTLAKFPPKTNEMVGCAKHRNNADCIQRCMTMVVDGTRQRQCPSKTRSDGGW